MLRSLFCGLINSVGIVIYIDVYGLGVAFCLVLCLVIIVVCGILWAFVVEWLWVVGFFWLFAYDCGYVGTLVNSVVVCVSLWFGCVACLKL